MPRRVLTAELLEDRLAPASMTVLTGTPDPSNFGQPVMFIATVTSDPSSLGTPTGTVTFADTLGDMEPSNDLVLGTRALDGGGQATLATNALAVGIRTILATYNDEPGTFGTSDDTFDQTVNQGRRARR